VFGVSAGSQVEFRFEEKMLERELVLTGKDGETDDRLCFTALREACALPWTVFGPVEFCAFSRFAVN
jgi:hypothetical protein